MRQTPNLKRVEYVPSEPPVHHAKFVDLTGQVFTDLKVLRFLGQTKHKKSVWECQCVCGLILPVTGAKMVSGSATSCGCRIREAHSTVDGLALTKPYAVWKAMRQRCRMKSHPYYKFYGARGVDVCDKWYDDFLAFWADMGPTYQEGLTLDRIDNDSGYYPENCRWITIQDQQRNRSGTIYVELYGQKVPLVSVAELFDVPYHRLYSWYSSGKNVAEKLESFKCK